MTSAVMLRHNEEYSVTIEEDNASEIVNNIMIPNRNVMPITTETYRNEHGMLVSTVPCSWDEAKRKLNAGDLLFGRSPEGARIYRNALTRIKTDWDSVDSYCKHRFLGYEYATKTRQANGEPPRMVNYVKEDATPGRQIALVKNDFPYNLTNEMIHYTIWATGSQPTSSYVSAIEMMFPSTRYEVLLFENLNKNKSVKTVEHSHLYVRKRPSIVTSHNVMRASL